jgi:hypothetical protein
MKLSDDRVASLLVGAFEGGSNYWIDHVEVKAGPAVGRIWNERQPFYGAPFSGGSIVVQPLDDPSVTLDRAAIQRGLRVMPKKYPHHFADVVTEQDDATTADVFLQCCLFGKAVYS